MPRGATPIDADEAEGLLASHVATRRELDELEEVNIQAGLEWARRRLAKGGEVLSESFVYALHRQLFGAVWSWAGTVRTTDKNIGIDKFFVRQEVRKLIADARFWREHETYSPDELAVRLHHRLAFIHPFPNGNGRHARMMADLLAEQAGRPPFSWGGHSLTESSEVRRTYISALRAADQGEMALLLAFARS